MSVKMRAEIKIYEVDETPLEGTYPPLVVRSHRTYHGHGGFVIIDLPNGSSVSVASRDLEEALKRCSGIP